MSTSNGAPNTGRGVQPAGMLDGNAVVITGAGRGLGRSYAIAMAAAGASVVVNDVDAGPAQEVVAEIRRAGGRAEACIESVSTWDGAERLVQTCVESFGRLDGVVNNAAVMHMGTPLTDTASDYQRLVEVNILGSAYVGMHAARIMAAAGNGRIVNVTSTAHLGRAGTSAYAATKGAICSLTYGWAVDLAGHGIKVNAIAPSAWTRLNDMFPVTGVDYSTLPEPDEVAPLAVYLVSDRVPFTGQVLRLEKRELKVMTLPHFPAKGIPCDHWTADEVGQALEVALRPALNASHDE